MTSDRGSLEDSFLTVAEVAELLKLNQQTVRNWIDQGSLPALRVGRRVRIRRSDLERLLEESSTAPPAGAGEVAGLSAEDFWGGEPIGLADPGELTEPAGSSATASGPVARAEPSTQTETRHRPRPAARHRMDGGR
jgi:excisionase family DNA binding protein